MAHAVLSAPVMLTTPSPTELDVAMRLLAAILAGGAVGINREIAGKPAGLRTHALVSLGAAAAVILGLSIAGDASASSRVLQGIVAGVGFIGGGVVLHDVHGVHGLTTAASIWVVATAGIASGAGLPAVAGLIVVMALLILIAGEAVDRTLRARARARALTTDDTPD